MLSLETAVQQILAALPPPVAERVPLAEAGGRVLAAPVVAPIALPPFDNSAMDGFAVRADDTRAASETAPVELRLVGEIPAGQAFNGELHPGECARIFTGSPVPAGADAVVMQEDARPAGDAIAILAAAKPLENIRLRGEDVRAGETVGEAGARIGPGLLNLLGAIGCGTVSVNRPPAVAVLATGSELRSPPAPLRPGEIYESNRAMIAAMIARTGARPLVQPLVRDSLAETVGALEAAFAGADLVVTSGGVSVGGHDYVKPALEALGGHQEFWRVAIKPGKPFILGRLGGKLLFGLPGNPVSAFVTFLMLVRPALLHWQGARELALPAHPGTLVGPLSNRGDRRHFVRVRVAADGTVRSGGTQASHMLHSLAVANGLVDLPPETTLAAGTLVNVLRFED